MTTFKDQLVEDMDVFFNPDEFAEEIVYTSQISGSKAILAIVEFNENFEDQEYSVREFGKITVKASDVQSPAYKDMFEYGGTTFTIRRILSGDGQTWTLEFERDVRPTFRSN